MRREYKLYLRDIQRATEKIGDYIYTLSDHE
jgi:hypothetical protein